MLPAPCLLGVIQNPSEMQSSVPVRGLVSPVKGEMPQTTCHEKKKNFHPKDSQSARCKARTCCMASELLLGGADFYGSGSKLTFEQ